MNKKPPGAELKKITTVCLYPSTMQKAKRLKVNMSRLLEQAIAAIPEPETKEENRNEGI